MRFNLVRALQLPGEKPLEELSQVRKFFDVLKHLYIANANRRSRVTISSAPEPDSKPTGLIRYYVDVRGQMRKDDVVSQALFEYIESSKVLKKFLSQQLAPLESSNAYRTIVLDEEQFFGQYLGPRSQAIESQARQERLAQQY